MTGESVYCLRFTLSTFWARASLWEVHKVVFIARHLLRDWNRVCFVGHRSDRMADPIRIRSPIIGNSLFFWRPNSRQCQRYGLHYFESFRFYAAHVSSFRSFQIFSFTYHILYCLFVQSKSGEKINAGNN